MARGMSFGLLGFVDGEGALVEEEEEKWVCGMIDAGFGGLAVALEVLDGKEVLFVKDIEGGDGPERLGERSVGEGGADVVEVCLEAPLGE